MGLHAACGGDDKDTRASSGGSGGTNAGSPNSSSAGQADTGGTESSGGADTNPDPSGGADGTIGGATGGAPDSSGEAGAGEGGSGGTDMGGAGMGGADTGGQGTTAVEQACQAFYRQLEELAPESCPGVEGTIASDGCMGAFQNLFQGRCPAEFAAWHTCLASSDDIVNTAGNCSTSVRPDDCIDLANAADACRLAP
jgi:hypothetical protein